MRFYAGATEHRPLLVGARKSALDSASHGGQAGRTTQVGCSVANGTKSGKRQATTAEMRLDAVGAARFSGAAWSTGRFEGLLRATRAVTHCAQCPLKAILASNPPEIHDYLDAAGHGEDNNGALFRPIKNNRTKTLEQALRPDAVYKLVRTYSALLGFEIGAHPLRATAATNALDHQADIAKVQEWLGHANIATTRIYDHRKTRLEAVRRSRLIIEPASLGSNQEPSRQSSLQCWRAWG